MNFVFISPHFPPQYFHFVTALRERGVNVLGLGDAPYESLRPELRDALREYFFVHDLGDSPHLLRALGYFTWRHGRIARIDSLNETWLEVEARLREDFHVPGLQPVDILRLRSKSGMARVFDAAGVPHPPLVQATDAAAVKALGARVGYPLVLKPDVGVGAARTFQVEGDADVDRAFAEGLRDFVAQAYVQGDIVTYDGLVDRDGDIVFRLSHAYSSGVMEVVRDDKDISFWSLREVPEALERVGRQAVAAFGLRERWFHLEFFRVREPGGGERYVALEMNLRPPGGFMTDMMNFACDIDVYRLWARLVTGEPVKGFRYTPRYHVCHTARRAGRPYAHDAEALARELGGALLDRRELPRVYQGAMGTEMWLTRHERLEDMHAAVRRIQALQG